MCVYYILMLAARLTWQDISTGTTKTDLSVKPTPVTQTSLLSSFGIKIPRNSTRANAIPSALEVFIATDMQPYSVVENSVLGIELAC